MGNEKIRKFSSVRQTEMMRSGQSKGRYSFRLYLSYVVLLLSLLCDSFQAATAVVSNEPAETFFAQTDNNKHDNIPPAFSIVLRALALQQRQSSSKEQSSWNFHLRLRSYKSKRNIQDASGVASQRRRIRTRKHKKRNHKKRNHKKRKHKNKGTKQEHEGTANVTEIADDPPGTTKKHYINMGNENDENENDVTPEAKIIGGNFVDDASQYPYFASVSGTAKYLCGATLVAPDLLLTAAHCQAAFSTGEAIVGATILGDNTTVGSVSVKIVQTIVHPDYVSFLKNDVMLLKIDPPLLPSSSTTLPNIPIAQLNINPFLPVEGESLMIMGFGFTEDDGPTSMLLLDAQVQEEPFANCVETYGESVLDPDIHICVWKKDALTYRGSCSGDSGGPLVIDPSTAAAAAADGSAVTATQFGLLSFGASSCSAGPSVYTRLSGYATFLQDTICNTSDYPPAYLLCDAAPTIDEDDSGGVGGGGQNETANTTSTTTFEDEGTATCNATELELSYNACFTDELQGNLTTINSCFTCFRADIPEQPQGCTDFYNSVCSAPLTCVSFCKGCSGVFAEWIHCVTGCEDEFSCTV